MLVDSGQFIAESDFEVMTFGNQKVEIWRPASAIDNSETSELPGDQKSVPRGTLKLVIL